MLLTDITQPDCVYKKYKDISYIKEKSFIKSSYYKEANIIGKINLSQNNKYQYDIDKYDFFEKYIVLPSNNNNKKIVGYIYVGENNYLQVEKDNNYAIFFMILLFFLCSLILFLNIHKTNNHNSNDNTTLDTMTLIIEDPITIQDTNNITENKDMITIQGYKPQVISEDKPYILFSNVDKYCYIQLKVTDSLDNRTLLETNLIAPDCLYQWEAYPIIKNEGSVDANIHIIAYDENMQKCDVEYDFAMRIKIQ